VLPAVPDNDHIRTLDRVSGLENVVLYAFPPVGAPMIRSVPLNKSSFLWIVKAKMDYTFLHC
jgi:hypothetical protein